MKRKTFKEWKAEGYHVIKGQKSKARNSLGEAVFAVSQVEKNKPLGRYYGGDQYDGIDHQEDYDQWYDSYGHTRDWA